MKRTQQLLLIIACFFVLQASGQISGYVFRDYNGNGIKDNSPSFNEPFVTGVTVKAVIDDITQFTTATDISGAYSFSVAQIPSGTKIRLEFSGLVNGDYSSFAGSANGTNIQFIAAPSSSSHYAINAPEDYWDNITNPNPFIMLTSEQRGTTNSFYKDRFSIIGLRNDDFGPLNPANSSVLTIDTSKRAAFQYQTGSLFGIAYQRKQERFFASAILKRASGLGPQGAGGIYIVTKSGANWNLSAGFTLQNVVPANGGPALDFGSVTRVSAPDTDDNYISDKQTWTLADGSDTRDIDAFQKATTMSYGEMDADHSSDNLYMINLYQRSLIVFNASAATASLNNASTATLAPYTKSYVITSLPGCPAPTGTGNNIRPFAIKIHKGKGYIGLVSDAMTTQLRADLRGYVLQFDPQNIEGGFITLITITFNNYRDIGGARYWRPWVNTWAQAGGTSTTGPVQYAQPVISGIEFNEDQSMTIGIRDRWGDQGGAFEYHPVSGSITHSQTTISGDVLHACYTGSGWALEGTPGSCDQPAANVNAWGTGNDFGGGYSYGYTGKEWYADISGDGDPESNMGGLTKVSGTGNVISTVYDPMSAGEIYSSNYWSNSGIQWNNITTGAKNHIARVQGESTCSLDKANSLGDIEVLSAQQPIQIGNRVWFDENGNGIQDPTETTSGVPTGTTVTLRSPGLDASYNTADDQTWTTATNSSGQYYFSSLSSADNRKPSSWVGIGNTILPGYDYRIEIFIAAGYTTTTRDVGGVAGDAIDNDAYYNSTYAVVNLNTGNINHNYDFGITTPEILASTGLQLNSVTENNGVTTINWQTLTENNTSYFELERSLDNINFTKTGNAVSAAINSNDLKFYTAKDNITSLQHKGTIYYRVKLYNKDGSYQYSNTIKVIVKNNLLLTIWPNPFTEAIKINFFAASSGKVELQLFEANGRMILNQQKTVFAGPNQLTISSIATLPSGTYILEVVKANEGIRSSFKLTK